MIRYFTAHPTAANLMMIGFLVLGIFVLPGLQRETLPRIEPRLVQVKVVYPGARPEDVEQAICQRIEDAVDGVDNVNEIQCEATEGLATAKLEMVEGSNLDRFFADVKSEVEAIDEFPDEVETPIIKQLGRTDFVASVAITGPTNRVALKAYAEDVKTRMLRTALIPKVEISGFSDHQIRIELQDATLRQFGLSISDIADAISRQSLDLPAGSIEASAGEVLVRLADERKKVQEFFDLAVIATPGGGQVRLGEIAKITDRFDLDEEKVVFNGKPAALLAITKTENEDTLRVIDAVREFIAKEKKSAPPGIDLVITNDISSIVRDRLNLLTKNMSQGLVLVFLVMWLFFGLRYSFWISLGLPVSFMGAFALMSVLGLTVNMLTMVGLLIVVGLLMDDAIVISENIAAKREEGLPPLDAAVEGTRQVLPGVFASFATTICIFGSLVFLQGDIGAILKVVPMVMICVLVISLVEAFLILPNHLYHSLEHSKGRVSRIQQKGDQLINWLRENWIGWFVDRTVEWRYLTSGVAVLCLLLAISAVAAGLLKFSAFPDIDGDTLEARILLPQGTPLDKTESVVDRVRDAVQKTATELQKNERDGLKLIKNLSIQFNKNEDANESGTHIATVAVDLASTEIRNTTNDDFIQKWREETGDLTDVISIRYTEPTLGPGGLAIDLRLQGENLKDLKQASLELQNWLNRYRGTFNISDDLRPGKLEMRVRLKDEANSLGLDARTISDQLRKAFFGTTVRTIQVGAEAYDIDVRLAAQDKNSLADLDYFTITNQEGELVPLSVLAEIEQGRGVSRINRIDGVRTVSVQGDVDVRTANANEVVTDTLNRFVPELIARYPGVSVSVQGQNKEAGTTQASMIAGFIIGLIGIFLLLSFQFKSYVEPFVVMIVIPFTLIGAIVGHLVMGLDFSMPSMLGFVALSGVVVNDSILLVNFIKSRLKPGGTVAQAATEASRARFRAIFLTSVTTVFGMLPMLLETSLQAQVLVPLVTSLVFGLMASTLLVLFVVPAIYAILDDFGLCSVSYGRNDQGGIAVHQPAE